MEDAEDSSGIFPAFLSFDISIGFTDATAGFIEDARFLVLDISGTSTDFLMDVEAVFIKVTGTSVTFMDFVTDSSLTGAEVADTEAVDTEVGFDIVTGFTVAEAGFIDTAGTSVIFLDFVTAVEMTNTEVAGTEVGFITAADMADLEVAGAEVGFTDRSMDFVTATGLTDTEVADMEVAFTDLSTGGTEGFAASADFKVSFTEMDMDVGDFKGVGGSMGFLAGVGMVSILDSSLDICHSFLFNFFLGLGLSSNDSFIFFSISF